MIQKLQRSGWWKIDIERMHHHWLTITTSEWYGLKIMIKVEMKSKLERWNKNWNYNLREGVLFRKILLVGWLHHSLSLFRLQKQWMIRTGFVKEVLQRLHCATQTHIFICLLLFSTQFANNSVCYWLLTISNLPQFNQEQIKRGKNEVSLLLCGRKFLRI